MPAAEVLLDSNVLVSAFLERLLVFPCVPGTPDLYRQAFRLAERYSVHPYDAAR